MANESKKPVIDARTEIAKRSEVCIPGYTGGRSLTVDASIAPHNGESKNTDLVDLKKSDRDTSAALKGYVGLVAPVMSVPKGHPFSDRSLISREGGIRSLSYRDRTRIFGTDVLIGLSG